MTAPNPAAPWPELVPLVVSVSPRPLPVDAFPRWVGAMISAVADSTGFDRDMAAAFALGVLSTCAQGRLFVKAYDDWSEQVCLYLAVVAEASEGKSPIYKPMVAPLHELNADLARNAAADVGQARAEREACESRRKSATSQLAKYKSDAPERHEHLATIRECDEELQKPAPSMPLLIVDDVTPETLGNLLEQQQERLAIITSEDHLFAHLAGRYNTKAPPIEIFLKAYTGEPMRVDRRDRVVALQKPCLTICAAMQPSVLTGKGAELADDRGLLARFLFVRPPRRTGYRDLSGDPKQIPPAVAAVYRDNVKVLAQRCRATALPGLGIPLSADAREVWKRWRVALELRRRDDGDLARVLTWAGKADGTALRLAGLLWLAEPRQDSIDAAHMENATRLADALAEHAMATLGLSCADLGTRSAHAVLGWLERRGMHTFTERDISRAGLSKGLDAKTGVGELVRRGYLRVVSSGSGSKGGRPTTRWDVRPGVLAGSDTVSAPN